jgi:translation initiation factor IF-2
LVKKNLKINIKNSQLAEATGLNKSKASLETQQVVQSGDSEPAPSLPGSTDLSAPSASPIVTPNVESAAPRARAGAKPRSEKAVLSKEGGEIARKEETVPPKKIKAKTKSSFVPSEEAVSSDNQLEEEQTVMQQEGVAKKVRLQANTEKDSISIKSGKNSVSGSGERTTGARGSQNIDERDDLTRVRTVTGKKIVDPFGPLENVDPIESIALQTSSKQESKYGIGTTLETSLFEVKGQTLSSDSGKKDTTWSSSDPIEEALSMEKAKQWRGAKAASSPGASDMTSQINKVHEPYIAAHNAYRSADEHTNDAADISLDFSDNKQTMTTVEIAEVTHIPAHDTEQDRNSIKLGPTGRHVNDLVQKKAAPLSRSQNSFSESGRGMNTSTTGRTDQRQSSEGTRRTNEPTTTIDQETNTVSYQSAEYTARTMRNREQASDAPPRSGMRDFRDSEYSSTREPRDATREPRDATRRREARPDRNEPSAPSAQGPRSETLVYRRNEAGVLTLRPANAPIERSSTPRISSSSDSRGGSTSERRSPSITGVGARRPGIAAPAQIFTPEELAQQEERKKALAKKKSRDETGVTPGSPEKGEVRGRAVKGKEAVKLDKPGRDSRGKVSLDDEGTFRKRHKKMPKKQEEDTTIRPTSLKIRLPITVKELAAEMKLKASQLVTTLFIQGIPLTINDLIADITMLQLLGMEFGCEIAVDTREEDRLRVTKQSIRDEILNADNTTLVLRPPTVAFMGHVDHGKTSLIDRIRNSNRVATEAGAITQNIGAFRCSTAVGDITILDTPGHQAFSAMRARGADVTDVVVLVVSGEEGLKQQSLEAINQARESNVMILVAINKCDRPNFDPELVYRQLAENELLPEVWGGQIITVNCSAITGEGIDSLLEMIALQAEVMELKADPAMRARGTVIEAEMHKGMGATAHILVQNGTLRIGDPVVCGGVAGKIKTMTDEFHRSMKEAGPGTPVSITGLSGLPEAGNEFVVVASEKEARQIAEARQNEERTKQLHQQRPAMSLDLIMQSAAQAQQKVFRLIIRAEVQGLLEALKTALKDIQSKKIRLEIIASGVGEVSESDVIMASTSKAVILGFHTKVETHAEMLLKEQQVTLRMHDVIYHAIDNVREMMVDALDKIAEERELGKVEIRAIFRSSQHGTIAGCFVSEGTISRGSHVRVQRGKDIVWKGAIQSLKRVKEDVKEVQKGFECGVVLNGFGDVKEGDILQVFDIIYIKQEL